VDRTGIVFFEVSAQQAIFLPNFEQIMQADYWSILPKPQKDQTFLFNYQRPYLISQVKSSNKGQGPRILKKGGGDILKLRSYQLQTIETTNNCDRAAAS
jgi:hypothetical protein